MLEPTHCEWLFGPSCLIFSPRSSFCVPVSKDFPLASHMFDGGPILTRIMTSTRDITVDASRCGASPDNRIRVCYKLNLSVPTVTM